MEQIKQPLIETESEDEVLSYYSVQLINNALSQFKKYSNISIMPLDWDYLLTGGEHNILANRFYDC